MAAMAVETPVGGSGSSDSPDRLPMPSRNPLPLSASQEAQVRELFHARVKEQCVAEVKAFADCALGRTLTLPFVCRGPLQTMNGCIKAHATPHALDDAREEWFAQRAQRQRERERKARRAAEQEAFVREWWGLPQTEAQAAARDAERERLRRGERVGGFPSKERKRFDENGEGEGDNKR